MPYEVATSPLLLAAGLLAASGLTVIGAGAVALAKARPPRLAIRKLAGPLMLARGALAGVIAAGIQG